MAEDILVSVLLSAVATTALFAVYEHIRDWWREREERKRVFRVLLAELHNVLERCDVNFATVGEEESSLHPTAPLIPSTLIPLGTLGWDLLRSTGVAATLDAGTLTHLYALYNQVDTHNKFMTLRERFIASDIPTSIQPTYIKDYDEKLLKTLEIIKTEIVVVEPEIKRRVYC
jgi:hypothetical protein